MKKTCFVVSIAFASLVMVMPSIAENKKPQAAESKRYWEDNAQQNHRGDSNREDSREARQIRELREEVRALRADIARLEKLMLRIAADQITESPRQSRNRWACLLDDRKAGSVYASGPSEYETIGKTLEKCHDKGGYCRERDVKCKLSD